MKLSTKDITSLPDQTKSFPGSIDFKEMDYLGGSFTINRIKPFEVSLSIIGGKKIHITFDSVVSLTGNCDRCLSEVEFDVPVSCDETIEISEGKVVEDEDIGPYSFIEEDMIDIDELMKNEILVNFPAKILCQDDCKGLCPVCGKNRNIVDCGCDDTVLDPRMAQFLDVFNSFKEV